MCCDGRRMLNIQNEFMAKDALLSLSWPTTSWTGEAHVWESGWRFVVLGCPCLTDVLWRFVLGFSEPCDVCCPWLFFWLDVTLCVLNIAWWGFECWLLEFADFGCWCCYLKKAYYAAFVHAIQRTKNRVYSSLRYPGTDHELTAQTSNHVRVAPLLKINGSADRKWRSRFRTFDSNSQWNSHYFVGLFQFWNGLPPNN